MNTRRTAPPKMSPFETQAVGRFAHETIMLAATGTNKARAASLAQYDTPSVIPADAYKMADERSIRPTRRNLSSALRRAMIESVSQMAATLSGRIAPA